MTPRREAYAPRDPIREFRNDHAELIGLLDAVEPLLAQDNLSPAGEAALHATIAHLEAQFASHMAAEEEVLFPQLACAFPECTTTLAPLHTEHAELRFMRTALGALLAMPPGTARDEQLRVQARDLIALLRIHVAKEEVVAFTLAERVLEDGEWLELSRRLATYRSTRNRAVPHRPHRKKGSRG